MVGNCTLDGRCPATTFRALALARADLSPVRLSSRHAVPGPASSYPLLSGADGCGGFAACIWQHLGQGVEEQLQGLV